MSTREIPREEWPEFLKSFSRVHEGWLSTVEVLDDQIGSQVEARDLPLQGIADRLEGNWAKQNFDHARKVGRERSDTYAT